MYEAATFSAYTVDTNGSCRSGTVAVYQIYNNAFGNFSSGKITINDGNHRFATDVATVNEMVAKGWKNEGIAYCVAP